MKVLFRRYETKQPTGDRSSTKDFCYNFFILLEDVEGHEFVAREINQFDSFYTHIRTYNNVYRVARKYADDLADILQTSRPKLKTMVKEKVVKEEWVEQETDEEEI